ncbi:MAG: hypothetical protein R8P61_35585 [Bacteroidia bacterium]|nr:hypothetical protein [Bacteroidia bacterium]
MKAFFSILLLCCLQSGFAQDEDFDRPFSFDLYGSFVPVFANNSFILTHLHAGISFEKIGNLGPSYSHWGYFNGFDSIAHHGLGIQVRKELADVMLKLESGLLFSMRRHRKTYTINLSRRFSAPYFRIHAAYNFPYRLIAGICLNWVPQTSMLQYNRFSGPGPVPLDVIAPLNRNRSISILVGFRLP